jgi:hypothetical protein
MLANQAGCCMNANMCCRTGWLYILLQQKIVCVAAATDAIVCVAATCNTTPTAPRQRGKRHVCVAATDTIAAYVLQQHIRVDQRICVAATDTIAVYVLQQHIRGERHVCVAATYTIAMYVLLQHIQSLCMCCCNIYMSHTRHCWAYLHVCVAATLI